MKYLEAKRIQEVEPNVRGLAGLHSPYEIVIEPGAVVEALAQEAAQGGVVSGWASLSRK